MSGSKSSFLNLNESFHSTVSFGDFSTVKVIKKGDVKIHTKNSLVKIISTVLFSHYMSFQVPFKFAVKKLLEQLKAVATGEYTAPVISSCRG